MYPTVVTRNPTAVQAEVETAYLVIFPHADLAFVGRFFDWAIDCFSGKHRDYQAVDARYHDFEHTLQGVLCLTRLLRGRHLANAQPRLNERMFQLALAAILFHDTGYLKKRDDVGGTGAKYTLTHVQRSAEFTAQFLQEKGFGATDIQAVQNMISCTGVNATLEAITFQSEMERIAGSCLATADLLGQMAAEDYVDKLPVLFSEFAEAAHYTKDQTSFVASFSSAEDLIRKTPDFWRKIVRVKLDRDFSGVHIFLNDPYPAGPNPYFERIEVNLARLRERF